MSLATFFDILTVLVLVTYAAAGFRQGFVISVTSVGGFVLGALAGLWGVPRLLRSATSIQGQPWLFAIVGVLLILLAAWLGQGIGTALGRALRPRAMPKVLRTAGSLAGAAVMAAAAAGLVWLLAVAARPVASPAVARALGQSRLLRAIDDVVPSAVGPGVSESLGRLLKDDGFPLVFGRLTPEPVIPASPPDAKILASKAIEADAASVVKINGSSVRCGLTQEGTGWVVAPHRVVTNAHVVAGMTQVELRVLGAGRAYSGRVVIFDPVRDLAVLDVPDLTAGSLRLGTTAKAGDPAVVAGFPLDGPYQVEAVRIRAEITALGVDIEGTTPTRRDVFSLYATIRPGNSGGPLLDEEGRVIGVVFARSVADPNTGYALTLAEAEPVLRSAASAAAPVSTGPCLAG